MGGLTEEGPQRGRIGVDGQRPCWIEIEPHTPRRITVLHLKPSRGVGGRGLAKQIDPREDPDYFNRVRAFAALQLTDEELKDWMT